MRWTEQDYSLPESNRITWGRDKDSSVTAPVPGGCLTTMVDFMNDSVCEENIVLGKDWFNACLSNGFSPLVNASQCTAPVGLRSLYLLC